ncbi:hypothetical protein AVEN_137598-1 [Araneus ventricosus]|uniref:Uncharacterized protein n=1 Tax=Araneus ventricosus TaxID=182803 RepID=A0A4Y2CVI3_ARAVE|nr:hypothetical protein AVEN_137598-1 [Araneus ventricosus]
MNKLLQLEAVKSVNNLIALRNLHDSIETQVRSLQSLNVNTETYSNLLFPVILQKIPLEINLQYNRQRKDEAIDIKDLITFIRKEIECRENAFSMSNPPGFDFEKEWRQPNQKQNHLLKTHFKSSHAMMNHSEPESNCVFCCKGNKSDTDHSSENWPVRPVFTNSLTLGLNLESVLIP